MPLKNLRILPCLFLSLFLTAQLWAQPQQMTLQSWSTGFNEPLELTHAGDARVFVVEKDGKIFIVDQQGNRNATPFLDIDARVNSGASERGLLGLAFHPDYQQNGYFYVNYTNSSGATIVARFNVTSNPDIADPNSEFNLLTISQPYSNHNGGCIKFGADGYLYVGMGDGGSGGDPLGNGQKPSTLQGKMLRLDVDSGNPYGIPADNPYVNDPNILDEIWAIGLRNPWRFSFDRATGDLWIGDVGQNNWEEIDYWPAGNPPQAPNFGWRCYEGNVAFNTSGCAAQSNYDFPVYVYPNNNANGCSVTGGYVYRGARYGNLFGMYIFTDYCSGNVWYTQPDGNGGWTTNQYANLSNFNFAAFGEDNYGQMYVLGLSDGTVYKIADTTCTPKAYIDAPANYVVCGSTGVVLEAFDDPALSYQWQLNGSDVPGATSASFAFSSPGNYTVIVSNGSCVDTSDVVALSFAQPAMVQITGLDTAYCSAAPDVTVSASIPGGTFTGNGISGNIFSPASAGIGTHTIVYTVNDANGCETQDSIDVYVDICFGVAPAAQLPGFNFYPNPGTGIFHFEFRLDYSSEMQIRVVNQLGQVVYKDLRGLSPGPQREMLDLSQLNSGMYFLELEDSEQKSVQKFVVRK